MERNSHRQQGITGFSRTSDNLIKLWLYRALVRAGGCTGMIGSFGWEDYGVAQYLGVADCVDNDKDPSMPLLESKLDGYLKAFDDHGVCTTLPGQLADNITLLGSRLRLSPTARTLLAFVILVDNIRLLACGSILLGRLSTTDLYHILATILGLTETAVRHELRHDGPLIRSGLVKLVRRQRCPLPEKINTLSPEFAERMLIEKSGELTVFDDLFFLSCPATLSRNDFVHVGAQFALLRALLRRNGRTRVPGINVLVYGPPGVGKTEFARVLAQEAGYVLHEVASSGRDGVPFEGEHRLNAYQAGTHVLARGKSLLLFDEAEDIFGRGIDLLGTASVAQSRKAWMNKALEENKVPTIWLTNAIDGLDPAFVRRFSMVIEMPVPTASRLQAMVEDIAGDLLSHSAIGQLVAAPKLAPAIVARAAQVVRAVRTDIGEAQTTEAMRILIDSTLVAQGHAGLPSLAANDAREIYSPQFVTADADLVRLTEGVRKTRRARLCLYGPPGTGKTAFGRWLADEIGAPLHVKRASDILSSYVGQTEQQLAKAFRSAASERAILLLDEVDSFLHDRKGARQSWEVTQVNEMLTQMESFDGVFIASTNLIHGLDPAAIRRFDLKIRFGFLGTDQAAALLGKYCQVLGLGMPGSIQMATLAALRNLTPGDFAAVARRHGFSPLGDVDGFVDALKAEARWKRDGDARAIGFVANG